MKLVFVTCAFVTFMPPFMVFSQTGLKVQSSSLTAVSTGERQNSEVYFAVGAKRSDGTEFYAAIPPTKSGEIVLCKCTKVENEHTLLELTLDPLETILVQVALMEDDCSETKRDTVAKALIPTNFIEWVNNNRPNIPIPVLPSGTTYTQHSASNWFVDILKFILINLPEFNDYIKEVVDKFCSFDNDDFLGAFSIRAVNLGKKIEWRVECLGNCEIIDTLNEGFTVKFTNEGEQIVTLKVSPPNTTVRH